MHRSIVAIVGRPNVGKSALLNRMVQSREAIVEDTPGVTRDRIYRQTDWNGRKFTLVDTGGILLNDPDTMKQAIRLQVQAAIDESVVILFIVDVREGLHALDTDVADLLRESHKPVILVANKADNDRLTQESVEFYSLGFGEPFPVSAVQGLGIGDLMDKVTDLIPEGLESEEEEGAIYLCISGRPNVGKSSILNAILGEERAIVTDIPGTTRDAVDSSFTWGGHKFVIVDTAGLRRKSKVDEDIEYYSGHRARDAIKRSHVGLLVLDSTDPAVMQDRRIGGLFHEEGKGLIVVINKWDLARSSFPEIDNAQLQKHFERTLKQNLDFLSYAPVLFTSALENRGISSILPAAVKVFQESSRRLDTPVLNQVFQEAFRFRPPPSYKGNALKLFYVHQATTNPPTFVFKVNDPKLVHFSYERYLENQLRRAFGFEGTPVKFIFKR